MGFRPITFLSQWPLKMVLTIPFLVQVISVVGITNYLSFKNGQATANDLASQLRHELTTRIVQQLQETVERPHIINQMNATALAQQDIDVVTGKGEHQLWQQAVVFPSTNLIYCANESDGAFLGVGAAINGQQDTLNIQVANEQTDRYFHYYSIDAVGQRSQLYTTGHKPFDPRNRPWYVAAKAKQQPTWSDIYLDFDTSRPTITASTPIYDRETQELSGVCATDLILSRELNRFLGNLDISSSGIAFIMEPSSLMIASSTQEPMTSQQSRSRIRLAAQDSQNPLIRETTTYLNKRYNGLDQVKSDHLDMRLEGQRFYLQVVRFQDQRDLDWIVVLVVPEHDFMARIHANTRLTIWLSATALLFSLVIGLAITHGLSQSLLQLSAMAKNIARAEWDKAIELDRSDAIGDLSRSLMMMATQLRNSFTTLEQRIEERTKELLQVNQELEQMARTDGLTQTANRGYFDYYLEVEWKRLARSQRPLSLILCDVDYFKAYNDTYGHQAGDRCLQHIAQALLQTIQRPADLVARYGGEEFAIVLSDTDTDGAVYVAKRIRKILRSLPLTADFPVEKPLTVSMGITTLIPMANYTPQDLIEASDQALYAAKAKGRDRYCVLNPSEASSA